MLRRKTAEAMLRQELKAKDCAMEEAEHLHEEAQAELRKDLEAVALQQANTLMDVHMLQEELRQERGRGSELQEILTDQDHDLAQQLQNFACKATISSPTSPAQQQDEDPPEAGGPVCARVFTYSVHELLQLLTERIIFIFLLAPHHPQAMLQSGRPFQQVIHIRLYGRDGSQCSPPSRRRATAIAIAPGTRYMRRSHDL
ncbi:hypothetical protein AK812_SmicGene22828 [Symbiodinium microadriaticum]|uniref:Uncharacterized protein n=1 Tax=Symbiodinium microadriaticum TaxID=2951 RepID=A0A1Q9DIR2_SYMMI|nr:hypothetical protein AK812_SmicGene22828 [Symbiodinium microadriaticum]